LEKILSLKSKNGIVGGEVLNTDGKNIFLSFDRIKEIVPLGGKQ